MGEAGVAALLFHHVGPVRRGTHRSLTVGGTRFESFVALLSRRRYVGLGLTEFEERRRSGTLPRRPVIITFDDGYADLAEYAFPVLRKFRFGATTFVATATIGGAAEWDRDVGDPHPILSADAIRRWTRDGLEFGGHGNTHSDLRGLSDSALAAEIERCGMGLEDLLGTPPRAFAYPYGSHDERVRAAVAGRFEVACGVDEGLNRSTTSRLELRRTMIQPADLQFDVLLRARLGYSPLNRLRSRLQLRRNLGRLSRRGA